jgi:DNA-binding winged helix-turn-helix (wHTH) protein
MHEDDTRARAVRFGVFELDLITGELRRKGVKLALQEQPFQVLAMLVEHAGDLVTREQLRERLWPDVVSIDSDHGVNKAVVKIRRALGDIAESPRYVETLERRGYRFLASVEPIIARPSVEPIDARVETLRLVWTDRTIPLVQGANMIGRDGAALVWIDSPDVSRRHAQVVVTGRSAILEDLGSKNGTRLNEQAVDERAVLEDGDAIRIGPALLVFRSAPIYVPTKTASG